MTHIVADLVILSEPQAFIDMVESKGKYSTKETGKGNGLDLSICYGIIEKHRGTIKVTSTFGEGTTFTITLPVDPQKKERRKKTKK